MYIIQFRNTEDEEWTDAHLTRFESLKDAKNGLLERKKYNVHFYYRIILRKDIVVFGSKK
jgi:hypothetical protein